MDGCPLEGPRGAILWLPELQDINEALSTHTACCRNS
jgi:hypothetical protein